MFKTHFRTMQAVALIMIFVAVVALQFEDTAPSLTILADNCTKRVPCRAELNNGKVVELYIETLPDKVLVYLDKVAIEPWSFDHRVFHGHHPGDVRMIIWSHPLQEG